MACEALSIWAQNLGFPQTALRFAEAAAAVLPEDPYPAFIARKANRPLGDPEQDHWRAEAFYDRAIRYACRTLGDKEQESSVSLGYQASAVRASADVPV